MNQPNHKAVITLLATALFLGGCAGNNTQDDQECDHQTADIDKKEQHSCNAANGCPQKMSK